jgi:hypothetical protein
MKLILDLPSPIVRYGEDYEYEPADYYSEMDIQIQSWMMSELRSQFYQSSDFKFRSHLLTFMRRHNLPIYQECYEDRELF